MWFSRSLRVCELHIEPWPASRSKRHFLPVGGLTMDPDRQVPSQYVFPVHRRVSCILSLALGILIFPTPGGLAMRKFNVPALRWVAEQVSVRSN